MVDFSPLLVLLLIMTIGFLLRRLNVLKDEHINALPAVLLNIAYPALVLNSVTSVDINKQVDESFIVIAVTFIVSLTLYFIGRLSLKKYKGYDRKPILIFNLAIGNIVYLVLPVIQAVFGELGVYYAVLHSATQDLLIWTIYYEYFQSGGGKNGFKLKNIININSISLIIAVILTVLGFRFTGVLDSVLKSLSGLTTPLALLYIGGVLGSSSDIKKWLPDLDTILLSVIKVILLPIVTYGIMYLLSAPQYLRILMALMFSAPATLMSTVWAKQMKCDYEFSIKILFFSTVLFLIMMIPFFLLIKNLQY